MKLNLKIAFVALALSGVSYAKKPVDSPSGVLCKDYVSLDAAAADLDRLLGEEELVLGNGQIVVKGPFRIISLAGGGDSGKLCMAIESAAK